MATIFNEEEIQVGSFVKFYDSQAANTNNHFSGKDSKFYPIGKVIKIYEYKYSNYGTERVCDIEIEGRISKGHFLSGITKV